MNVYTYDATDQLGRTLTGQITAANVSSAVTELERRGMSVKSLRETSAEVTIEETAATHSALHRRINAALEQREPLIAALGALTEDMPKDRCQRSLQRLNSQLASGQNAAQLLADEQSAVWLPMLVRGIAVESTGKTIADSLDAVFRENQIRRQRTMALAYPAALIAIAALVLGFLCTFIVPQFRKMFEEFGLRLPAPTILLIWITDQLTIYATRTFSVVLVIAILAFPLVKLWRRSTLPARLFGWLTAGSSRNVSAMASFTHVLAELLSLEATLPEALQIAGRSCQHSNFRSAAESLARHVSAPASPLFENPVAKTMPPTLIYALQSGVDGQPNISLIRELSAIYSERVRLRADWASGAVGPIAVFVVGAAVLFIVVALFMPLVAMVSSLA